ncbi:hypothetical protein C8R43DRAFT_960380 [Mycena crocata]|nr:hypothetical protein C8R43DRAFT_960380 [Mycena crocata]
MPDLAVLDFNQILTLAARTGLTIYGELAQVNSGTSTFHPPSQVLPSRIYFRITGDMWTQAAARSAAESMLECRRTAADLNGDCRIPVTLPLCHAPEVPQTAACKRQNCRRLLRDCRLKVSSGPGGMGKTTLAMAAIHQTAIKEKYNIRHFISCESAKSVGDLVSTFAMHLGLEPSRQMLNVLVRFLSDCGPCLVVLDNVETPWEPLESRGGVEELLSLLGDIPSLSLLITMRGLERPAKFCGITAEEQFFDFLYYEAVAYASLGNFPRALEIHAQATEMVVANRMEGSIYHLHLLDMEAGIHREKSEYTQARELLAMVASKTSPSHSSMMHSHAMATLSLDITISGDEAEIMRNLNCAKEVYTAVGSPRIIRCSILTAQLYLHRGDKINAHAALKRSGDEQTALNLYRTALEGATEMDIHRLHVKCMAGIGDIMNGRGDSVQARGL